MIPASSPRRVKATAAALAILLMAGTAAAQTPLPVVVDPLDARDARRVERMEKVVRELRAIVFQLRDTGAPVVVQPADTDARMADLSNRIGDLEQTLTRLNGSLESVTHELDLARRANTDLQGQVKAMADKLAAQEQAAPPPAAVADTPAPGASAADAFARARQLMMAGDFDSAERGFADFVAAWPTDAKAPEASYYLGRTLTVRGAHADAAKAYVTAVRGYPKTGWAPDAMLELARSLNTLKRPTDACATLAELARRYPKPPSTVTTKATALRAQAKCAA